MNAIKCGSVANEEEEEEEDLISYFNAFLSLS
jgi:hypothetical protein